MTEAAETNICLALSHNAVAKQYLTAAKNECVMREKQVVQSMLNRCINMEQDMFSAIPAHQVERFREQILRTDYIQFEHIFTQLLMLEQSQRDAVEQMVDMLVKGETLVIEHVDENNYPKNLQVS